MRLNVQVLPLSTEAYPATFGQMRPRTARNFLLPVDPETTFTNVWGLVFRRYLDNYPEARLRDYQFKRITITGETGQDYDVVLNDTVGSLSAGKSELTIKIHQMEGSRESSLGPSFLHIPHHIIAKRRLSGVDGEVEAAQEAKRRQTPARHREGTADPASTTGRPETTHEGGEASDSQIHASAPTTAKPAARVDGQGFKIPDMPRDKSTQPSPSPSRRTPLQEMSRPAAIDSTAPAPAPMDIDDDPARTNFTTPADTTSTAPAVVSKPANLPKISPNATLSLHKPQSSKAAQKRPFSPDSSEEIEPYDAAQMENMRITIRNGGSFSEMKKKYFHGCDPRVVLEEYQRLERKMKEEKRKAAEAQYTAAQIRREEESAIRSTSDKEVYTKEECTLLIAARLEGAEISRIARKHFPRREVQRVQMRAINLWRKVERDVQRIYPGAKISRKTVCDTLEPEQKLLFGTKCQQISDDIKEFQQDRLSDFDREDAERKKHQDKIDRNQAHSAVVRNSMSFAKSQEQQKAERDRLADLRAAEDSQNMRQWQIDLAKWEIAAELARKKHQAIPRKPELPTASTHGIVIHHTGQVTPPPSSQQRAKTSAQPVPVAGPSTKQKTPGLAVASAIIYNSAGEVEKQTPAKAKNGLLFSDASVETKASTPRKASFQFSRAKETETRPSPMVIIPRTNLAESDDWKNGNPADVSTGPKKKEPQPKVQIQTLQTTLPFPREKGKASAGRSSETKSSKEKKAPSKPAAIKAGQGLTNGSPSVSGISARQLAEIKRLRALDAANHQIHREIRQASKPEEIIEISSDQSSDLDMDDDDDDDQSEEGSLSELVVSSSATALPATSPLNRMSELQRHSEADIQRLHKTEAAARVKHDNVAKKEWVALQKRAKDRAAVEAEARRPAPDYNAFRTPHQITEGEESADEEIDRMTGNGFHPVSSPPEPSPELPRRQINGRGHFSQESIRTEDLRPPFPSSGKVRSPTPTPPRSTGKLPSLGLREALKNSSTKPSRAPGSSKNK